MYTHRKPFSLSLSLVLAIIIISSKGFLHANDKHNLSVNDIIEKTESMLRANSSMMDVSMKITTPKWNRTIKCSIWSKGNDYSFIQIHYPKRDKGVTFLKRDKQMWHYIPKVERVIKIPPSMMMQSWMGSDFTNDDLVRESSYITDYKATLLETTTNNYKIQLIPLETAPVTWGNVIMHIDKQTYIPVYQAFYDELGVLVRIMQMSDIKQIGKKWYPMKWSINPQERAKKGHNTSIEITKIKLDLPIKDSFFSLRKLKQ
ncbi:outer membrane lipoprotein-sorting protein [bacterium]|nr:outer membrane lipoprotein-sorting protein [bacterium]